MTSKKAGNKQTLKKLKFGIEFELFTLDQNGYMTNGADRLIKRVKEIDPKIQIKRECGKNMVEITTPPSTEVPNVMLKALENFETVVSCAEKEKIVLYAYGTYPGVFTPDFHADRRYKALEKIMGKQRFLIAGRCIGLHIHYSLPWGVFDYIEKIIKPLIISKNKQSMVDIYNLGIAMDPALSAFSQSSPFYQGKYLAKDSRIVVIRGGNELDYPQGLYANFPKFGALPNYKSTSTDILNLIQERFFEWTDLLKKIGRNVFMFSKHGSILDNTWNPVKINAHGTIEIRGMDMNHPDIVAAICIIVKFVIKAVQDGYLRIIPSDIGIEEPFKKDDNIIYIPPDSYVQKELQKKSAYEGLANDTIRKYCGNLIKLAKNYIPEERQPMLQPLEDMLALHETASDKIIKRAKELGINPDEEISESKAAELALALSFDLYNEIVFTKQNLERYLKENTVCTG